MSESIATADNAVILNIKRLILRPQFLRDSASLNQLAAWSDNRTMSRASASQGRFFSNAIARRPSGSAAEATMLSGYATA
jgi:hypothetical protein